MYVLFVCVCGETTQKQLGDNYSVKFSSERQPGKCWCRLWQRISSLGRDGLFKAPSLRLRSDAFHHCLGCLFKYSHCWMCGVLQILSDWGGRLSVFVICLECARSVFAGRSAAASGSVSLCPLLTSVTLRLLLPLLLPPPLTGHSKLIGWEPLIRFHYLNHSWLSLGMPLFN